MEEQHSILLEQYFAGRLEPAQREQFMRWLEDPLNRESFINTAVPLMLSEDDSMEYDDAQWEIVLKNILDSDKKKITVRIVHRVHFLRTAWFRYAAVILIVLGIGGYLWNTRKPQGPVYSKVVLDNKIKPGGQRALLTLSDGSTIILDSAINGQLAVEGNSRIIKTSTGQLVYESDGLPIPSNGGVAPPAGSLHRNYSGGGAGVGRGESMLNTMRTPRGGQYQLTLPDQSKVWLNSESSITYPVAFTEKTREVYVAGEVYFEITQNKSKPFIVRVLFPDDKKDAQEIIVLGTSFNVNSYKNEPSIKTSLINGSVKINGNIIKPGQAFTNGKIIKTSIDQDIAWKNGVFNFNNTPVDVAMRQLSRWYDIEIKYDGGIPKGEFGGKIGRNLSLTNVLALLDGVGVKLKLEGRVLHVKSL